MNESRRKISKKERKKEKKRERNNEWTTRCVCDRDVDSRRDKDSERDLQTHLKIALWAAVRL